MTVSTQQYRVYKKKFTLAKYLLSKRARKIGENLHPLVHPALKLFRILSFYEQEILT